MHHKLQVYGFRINNFAYITDLKTISDSELKKLEGLDVLILNALRHKEHYSHINLNQAIEFIRKIKPNKSYLTHSFQYVQIKSRQGKARKEIWKREKDCRCLHNYLREEEIISEEKKRKIY